MTGGPDTGQEAETGRPYVEYCLANVSARRRELLEEADVPTRGVACLDRCGRCFRTDFLVVDGTPIEGAACDRFVEGLEAGDPE